jgi:glucose/arabinose dehydrogenase
VQGEAGEWASRIFSTHEAGDEGTDTDLPWYVRPGFAMEEIAGGFQLAVNIAMVPNPGPHPGDPLFYVAELYGNIKEVSRDGTVRDYATGLLDFEPTGDFPGSGEMGLAGLVVEPETGDLFASLVYEREDGLHYPKVIRLHSDEQGWAAEGEPATILDMDEDPQGASHQVSNLTISPDGYLYLHNGEGGARETSQDLEMFRGKILRMTLDGEPVGPEIDQGDPNPFFDAGDGITARDYIWAYGFRNPFGGAWRLSDGTHWTVENGSTIDRLAKVVEGENYRWPEDESMSHRASYRWSPAHAPVNIEFVEAGRFGGSGFPLDSMGHAFVTESGPSFSLGPQDNGKRITEFGLDTDGDLNWGPETLVEYRGVGHATAAGLAAGPDGLYFSDLYSDPADAMPVDRGAHVYRISYCGNDCPEDEAAAATSATSALLSPELPVPEIAGFRSRRAAFAVAGSRKKQGEGDGTSSAVRYGTYFAYAMQTRAEATISIRRVLEGEQVGGSCHKPGQAWRIVHRSDGHCLVWSHPGSLSAPGAAGWHRRPFSGYLGRRWLRPGRYVAAIQARDSLGRVSQTHTTKFRIVRDRAPR